MADESLQQLEERERAISRERRQLHRRIEFLQGTGAHEEGARALLAELVVEERDISRRRRELHVQIDRVRAERVTPTASSPPVERFIAAEPTKPSWYESD